MDHVVISGYATVYDTPYVYKQRTVDRPNGWTEIVAPGAADASVKRGDPVELVCDHTPPVFASTRAGTLKLTSDEVGLWFDATPDMRDRAAVDMVRRVERGHRMSYRAVVTRDRWEDLYGNETDMRTAPVRRVLEVRLSDVSVVEDPANPATIAYVKRNGTVTAVSGGMSIGEARDRLAALSLG